MKYIKKYEVKDKKNDWNKVLHDATWTAKFKTGTTEIIDDENPIDLDKVKLAIENGADPDHCGTLSWAVRINDFPTVKYMIEHGANVNSRKGDSTKWTPLMLAVANTDEGETINVEMCKFLIDNGADPTIGNFQDINTLDLLSHTKMRGFSPAYPSVSKDNKIKMDAISKHIIQNVVDKNPETAYKYEDYLTDEQKEKYRHYIDANKYNL